MYCDFMIDDDVGVEMVHTFLNIKFKNAAIEPIEFDFVEGSIANRFIELRNTQ